MRAIHIFLLDQSILFNQSCVPQHAELAWIFNCVTRLGWLNRMTQFKEKAGKNRENASVGLYAYPTLMAADILTYRATHVPVGEDQKQHLELTRDIAQAFNSIYNIDAFPIPEPQIFGSATRVMSLRDGSAKMSKSDPSDNSRINMTDDADMIAQKIRKAKTDADALPSEAAGLADRPTHDFHAVVADVCSRGQDFFEVQFRKNGGDESKLHCLLYGWLPCSRSIFVLGHFGKL